MIITLIERNPNPKNTLKWLIFQNARNAFQFIITTVPTVSEALLESIILCTNLKTWNIAI